MTTALLFAGGGVMLVVGSELFTNAVEWAGFRMRIAAGATGSLLAALGTSLPETVVPIVALSTHARAADAITAGVVLGSPFLLLTLATALTGVALLLRRRRRVLTVEPSQVRRDLGVFVAGFSVVLICTALPFPARAGIGALLLVAYGVYVRATLRGGAPSEEMPEPLHLVRWRLGEPHPSAIAAQLVAAVALLAVGSDLFVAGVGDVASALTVSPVILALVVVPIATELPESLNSVLWVRSGDDGLAFGNIGGSTAFQATVLGFIGITFTGWSPGTGGLISGGLTLASGLALLVILRRGRVHGRVLLLALLPWLGYVVAELVTGGHLGG